MARHQALCLLLIEDCKGNRNASEALGNLGGVDPRQIMEAHRHSGIPDFVDFITGTSPEVKELRAAAEKQAA